MRACGASSSRPSASSSSKRGSNRSCTGGSSSSSENRCAGAAPYESRVSRADCADLAEAAPRSSTSLTTSRKPSEPFARDRRGPRIQKPARALSCVARPQCVVRQRPRFASVTAAVRTAAAPAVRFRDVARLVCCPDAVARGARDAVEPAPRVELGGLAADGAERGGARRALRARLADGFGLDLADGVFERQALARDVRLGERRLDRSQLRDQSRARALVRAPGELRRCCCRGPLRRGR